MATTIPKRSSRLRSRDHSIKILSETKYGLRKVTTVNKNTPKVNVSARRLRPRQSKKNYCDDSRLLQKHVPTKQHDSVVILEKLDLNKKKVPIYKTLKSEKSLEEKNDIYEFKYNVNDTKERLKKKKKKLKRKNVNKTESKVTKKTRLKKKIELSKIETVQTIKEAKSTKKEDIHINKIEAPRIDANVEIKESVKKDVNQIETLRVDTSTETIKETVSKEDSVKTIKTARIEIAEVEIAEESVQEDIVDGAEILKTDSIITSMEKTALPETTLANQNKQTTKKPKIISIENADNITVTRTSSSDTEDSFFRPFRPKNIFDNKTSNRQSKNTLNLSSLAKSVSPITKISNNQDFASPWRPPTHTFPMFSQAKHFIQSTPNVSMERNNENTEQNKENMEMNKENKHRRNKEKKKKADIFPKKHIIPKQFLSTNQNQNKIQTLLASKVASKVEQPAPSRISLGKIKTLLQEKPNDNKNNKQMINEMQVKADKSLVIQEDKQRDNLANYLNFSDTFDIMSDTEKRSNLETNIPLFVDLEPSHFSTPPQHSYKRKRVKFNLLENDSEGEEEKKDAETRMKKKKVTKSEKEHQRRVNEWVKSINSTFEEIDNYNLLIE